MPALRKGSEVNINEMPSGFLQCRSYGHAWDSVTIEFLSSFWIDHLVCERCQTERRDHIRKNSGEVSRRQYKYPEGYRAGKGVRVLASDSRQRLYQRVERTNDGSASRK